MGMGNKRPISGMLAPHTSRRGRRACPTSPAPEEGERRRGAREPAGAPCSFRSDAAGRPKEAGRGFRGLTNTQENTKHRQNSTARGSGRARPGGRGASQGRGGFLLPWLRARSAYRSGQFPLGNWEVGNLSQTRAQPLGLPEGPSHTGDPPPQNGPIAAVGHLPDGRKLGGWR